MTAYSLLGNYRNCPCYFSTLCSFKVRSGFIQGGALKGSKFKSCFLHSTSISACCKLDCLNLHPVSDDQNAKQADLDPYQHLQPITKVSQVLDKQITMTMIIALVN